MTDTEHSSDSRTSQPRTRPDEAEVSLLLQQAAQQYEEYIRLADLADISEAGGTSHPRYAWDNPIGLVVSRRSNARLV